MPKGGEEPVMSAQRFGGCCAELKAAMAGQDFEPLITDGDDGVLYMVVGLSHLQDEEAGMVDHPLFFGPFCGAKLQTADEVKGKVENEPVASD